MKDEGKSKYEAIYEFVSFSNKVENEKGFFHNNYKELS